MKKRYSIIGLFVILVSLSLGAWSTSVPSVTPKPAPQECGVVRLANTSDEVTMRAVMQAHARAALEDPERIASCELVTDKYTGLTHCESRGCPIPCVQSGASCFCAYPHVSPSKEN
jgi:hypothetical protein